MPAVRYYFIAVEAAMVFNPETAAKVAKRQLSNATIAEQQTGGIWLCKINNCNKPFARESDLKRHQKTSKVHRDISRPVCCPQCDSTFTRSDALKRHQRSRHGGRPSETPPSTIRTREGEDSDEGTPTPQRDRSAGRHSETKSEAPPALRFSPIPTVMTQPEAPGRPTDTQSYYDTDMVNTVFIPPVTPGNTADFQNVPKLPSSFPIAGFQSWFPYPPLDDKQKDPKSRTGLSLPQSIPISQYTISNFHPPDAQYRMSYVPPAAMPSDVATMQIDPSLLPKVHVNGLEGDNTASPIPSILNLSENTDSSPPEGAATASVLGAKPEDLVPKESQQANHFSNPVFSPDVQDVLTAVLTFDATIDTNGGELDQCSGQVGYEDPNVALSSSIDPCTTVLQNERETTSSSAPNATLDSGHQNEATLLDADERPDFQIQGQLAKERPQNPETLPLPDGIRELINEDSFS